MAEPRGSPEQWHADGGSRGRTFLGEEDDAITISAAAGQPVRPVTPQYRDAHDYPVAR